MKAAAVQGATPVGITARKADHRAARGCRGTVDWTPARVRLKRALRYDHQPPVGVAGWR